MIASRSPHSITPGIRTYVLDTSVLLSDPWALLRFDEHEVVLPHSKLKQYVAELLKKSGFLREVKVTDATVGKTMAVIVSVSLVAKP